ncbi:glycosyltransferase family 2 protein [Paenibacillus bouchesdurhonensis]|uniref:glycosyltransferase family 2 protein n=1 Tax=Paenibacillus bouchesdurhonensis TaxID=1870990 RepID=UPI000DA60E65|nr:glycosyltransferase family 2 protein [Paenibacillus bouchesdurhonensis]
MIVKNEEKQLQKCLDSVCDIVDEIIIVDTGSTDRTKEIARSYTTKIYDFQWNDDFAAARNDSFGHATKEFIMWLDADDLLLPTDRDKLKRLKRTLSKQQEVIMMDYHLAFCAAGEPLILSRRHRLVRRDKGFKWKGIVHEDIEVSGARIAYSDIAVTHSRQGVHTERNLRILEKWIASGGSLEGRLLLHYGSELADLKRYEEAVVQLNHFLKQPNKYKDDCILACIKLADCCGELGLREKKLEALLQSFQYDLPQSEICCAIGSCFEERGQWAAATYWYLQALHIGAASSLAIMENRSLRTWVPHSRLCICYAQQGDLNSAYNHNEKALEYLPQDRGLLENRSKLQHALGMLLSDDDSP